MRFAPITIHDIPDCVAWGMRFEVRDYKGRGARLCAGCFTDEPEPNWFPVGVPYHYIVKRLDRPAFFTIDPENFWRSHIITNQLEVQIP